MKWVPAIALTALMIPWSVIVAQPSARAHHQLVTGPGGNVLLIGGSTRAEQGYLWFDDVWSWRPDSERWIPSDPLPFARSSHALAYDRARGEVVLLGGIGGRGEAARGTVWVRSDGDWEMRDEPAGDGWAEPAVCYDRTRERVVIFGGWDRENEFRGDTWEWDGERLARVASGGSSADTGPAARAGHDMAYDPVRGRCIMFGGRGDAGLLPGTWEWDGERWERIPSGADEPPPRWFFGMATADAWNRVVVFGGASGDGDLADTWLWDGSAWKPVAGRAPPARGMSRIAFDGEHVVLFGGRRARQGSPPFEDLADTWLFDGKQWSAAFAEATPRAARDSADVWVRDIGVPQYFAVLVEDLERSATWYRAVFGLEELGGSAADDGSWRISNVGNEHLFVELIRDDRATDVERARGFRKVGFHVPDVEIVADRVARATGERPRVLDFSRFGVRIIQIRDPDGNIIQLFSPTAPDE